MRMYYIYFLMHVLHIQAKYMNAKIMRLYASVCGNINLIELTCIEMKIFNLVLSKNLIKEKVFE